MHMVDDDFNIFILILPCKKETIRSLPFDIIHSTITLILLVFIIIIISVILQVCDPRDIQDNRK